LKAGGAYVPLDPDDPAERLAFMVGDSRTSWILSQSHLAGIVSRIAGASTHVLFLDQDWETGALPEPTPGLTHAVQARNLAYVLYTSGSTGTPKGVMIEHRALCNRILWMQRQYPLDPADRVLQKTPFGFDVSGWEFHWPLLAGARIVLVPPGKHKDPEFLRDCIRANSISVIHFVPPMLQAFLSVDRAGECQSLRHVFCSGEELTPNHLARFFERFDNTSLHNLYGPTEAAIDVSFKQCRRGLTPVTIGKPIANVQLHVLDPRLQLLPIGLPGELCIAGDALARGYLNRPELTAERFVDNPFAPGTRLYRTGDLARWTTDGEIQFLGRLDQQVKIRGCRVELGEIESVLAGLEGVRQAAVVAQPDGETRKLVAFYVAGASNVSPASLRDQLRRRLPEPMVPSAFIPLEALPLTTGGKVDRRTLSRRPATAAANCSDVQPVSRTEARLVALWCEALSRDRIGVHESFFDLGGHSVSALSLMTKINAAFNSQLPLATLLETRCIAELARRLDAKATPSSPAYITALQPHGSRPPLFLIPGLGGGSLGYLPLSRALGPDQPLFLFQPPGLQGERQPLSSIQDLAAFYIDQLPASPPPAGYRLGGWSMGGVVAYEMACQLARIGIRVDLLILIDSYLQEHWERFARIAGGQAAGFPATQSPLDIADPIAARHVAGVHAAHHQALAAYRATEAYPGTALFFYAAGNSHLPSGDPGPSSRQTSDPRWAEETRAVWQQYLPAVAARFVTVDATHESILQQPAVSRVATAICSFCGGLAPSSLALGQPPVPSSHPNSRNVNTPNP
jgi:amino acid adenylation domain-containing protein